MNGLSYHLKTIMNEIGNKFCDLLNFTLKCHCDPETLDNQCHEDHFQLTLTFIVLYYDGLFHKASLNYEGSLITVIGLQTGPS